MAGKKKYLKTYVVGTLMASMSFDGIAYRDYLAHILSNTKHLHMLFFLGATSVAVYVQILDYACLFC